MRRYSTAPHRWIGILRFAVSNLLSWGEIPRTTIEQVNRWLCQPAVIPIIDIRGEAREYLLLNCFRALHVRVRNRLTLLTHVQSTFNALIVVSVAAHRTRLRRIAFRHQLHVDTLNSYLVVEWRREAVKRPSVSIEIIGVAPEVRRSRHLPGCRQGRQRHASRHRVRHIPQRLLSRYCGHRTGDHRLIADTASGLLDCMAGGLHGYLQPVVSNSFNRYSR